MTEMDPETAQPAPSEPAIHDHLPVMQPGEQVICEIRRHPIGMFGVYGAAGSLLIVLLVVVFIVGPHFITNYSNSQIVLIGGLIFAAATIMAALFLFVVNKVYWGNRWIVTTDSIIQVKQTSLFDKQTSQLSLTDLEDITAEQDGLLAQLYHYGVISAETAGASDRFTFPYCPNPSQYAQKILAARERFEQARRHDTGAVQGDAATSSDEPTVAEAAPLDSGGEDAPISNN